jgi:hypothetical protein
MGLPISEEVLHSRQVVLKVIPVLIGQWVSHRRGGPPQQAGLPQGHPRPDWSMGLPIGEEVLHSR